jgi:hypothetical protein
MGQQVPEGNSPRVHDGIRFWHNVYQRAGFEGVFVGPDRAGAVKGGQPAADGRIKGDVACIDQPKKSRCGV